MDLKSLRKFILIGIVAITGQAWATVSLPPAHGDASWNDISNIAWSTDNGATWGQSALTVGQTVQFQVTLHKTLDGRHYADFVKTWIDWGGDGVFNASEVVIFDKHVVNTSKVWKASDSMVNESFAFTSSGVTLTNAMLGNHFLLARVTCSESLLNSNGVSSANQWTTPQFGANSYDSYFKPLQGYWQGESESLVLTVNGVPEPGTLALFAVGMAGLGFGRKRMSRV